MFIIYATIVTVLDKDGKYDNVSERLVHSNRALNLDNEVTDLENTKHL